MEQIKDTLSKPWRSAMAKMYLIVCIFDFIIFPILWSILQAYKGGEVTQAWIPITTHGGGMFHISLGAILGVSAWGKSQERVSYNRYSDISSGNKYKRIPQKEDQEL